jgi:signal transduction histidine kinase
VPNDVFSVLIVEDDKDARQNMEDILSLDGYATQTAAHCLEAINAVESTTFDAVILDWNLPDQNADQLIPIISKHQPDTPVVVVTGMRDFDTAVKALRSGAYDFFLKPINPEVLRSVLWRIVERKKHLAAIEDAQKNMLMNERLAAIGQMVAGLAHESRNALQRSHACLAELALDLRQMPQSMELVQKIQKALDDVNFLLEEVRDYSAPIILERRHCCLESLVLETWQEIMEAQKINPVAKLEIHKSDNFPKTCFVDCDRIQQVVRNLLENALFASSSVDQVRVHLSHEEDRPHQIRIEVSDDGPGVPEADRENIFVPFFTTKTKGTGLGLAVSRRFVEAHEGRIFVDNGEPVGARFVIELPMSQR